MQEIAELAGNRNVPGARFAQETGGASSATKRAARVLIVEDDHLVALEIEATLLEAGFEVVGIAATAEEALGLGKSSRPDLAVMDIRLAGKRDGVDAALDLFREEGIRCVFATAHQDAETRRRAEPARPLGWLSKPYRPDVLVKAVRAALAQGRPPHGVA